MLGDIGDLAIKLRVKIIAARVAHQSRTGAVTAVGRTPISHQKKHPVGIAVHQSRHRRMFIFAHRVQGFPRSGGGFFESGNDLTANRTEFVGSVDKIEERRSDGQGQLGLPGQKHSGPLFASHARQQSLQLLNSRHAILELPFPIVPLGVGHGCPTPLPCGLKHLQRGQPFLIFR